MFFGILFIAIGLAILLNTLGMINGTFWGLFWAIFFLAVGFKMITRKDGCPVCSGLWWNKKVRSHCCDEGHDHNK